MSPDVWKDAKAVIADTAAQLNIPVEWPNEMLARPSGTATWLAVEGAAESAESYELGNTVWDEHGTIWLHIMIPIGLGIDIALAQRKAFSVAFRVTSPTPGLYYRAHAFDPLGPDDGMYRRLSLLVRYEWTDLVNPNVVFAEAAFHGFGSRTGG